MEIAILIIAVVVMVAVYWFVIRKPAEEESLPEAPKPKGLVEKPHAQRSQEKEPRSERPKPKEESEAVKAKAEKKVEQTEKQPSRQPEVVKEAAVAEVHEPTLDGQQHDEPSDGPDVMVTEASSEVEEDDDVSKPMVGEAVATSTKRRPSDVAGLRKGLGKSRSKEGFFGRLARLITGQTEIDPALVDEMEEVLITSDVGVKTTEVILGRIREGMKSKELTDSEKVWGALRKEAIRILSVGSGGLEIRTKPSVVLMVGVNGSGKTTTIGKLATQLKAEGKTCVLAAGDTFRAAAVQQLQVWGDRVGCDVVKGKDGSDPGAVIFDAIRHAGDGGADLVLADTAGRLHTKTNLMEELKKVVRTMGKAMDGAPHEILLVIDATNGQNAMQQSRQFVEALPVTGIVLTKLDGTAKGGVILGICDELGVPVRYIGLGERADDLRPFSPEEFVEALLGNADSGETEAA